MLVGLLRRALILSNSRADSRTASMLGSRALSLIVPSPFTVSLICKLESHLRRCPVVRYRQECICKLERRCVPEPYLLQ